MDLERLNFSPARDRATRRLIAVMDDVAMGVTTAAWIRPTAEADWYLHLATPLATLKGSRWIYDRLLVVLGRIEPLEDITPLDICVFGENDPLFPGVNFVVRRDVNQTAPTVVTDAIVPGGVRLAAAIVYRANALAATTPERFNVRVKRLKSLKAA